MMREKFDTVFEQARGNMYVYVTEHKERLEANLFLLQQAVDEERPVVYVMVDRPFTAFQHALSEIGVYQDGAGNSMFIDTITRQVGSGETVEDESVMYLEGPQDLTNLGPAISAAFGELAEDNILVVFDSLSALLTYNTPDSVARFLEDLEDRIQTLDTNIVFFHNAEDTALDAALLQYVDEVFLLHADSVTATVEQTVDHTVVNLPRDVAVSMGWADGDELAFTITDKNTLELEKE